MNKLMIIASLLIVVPVAAMELDIIAEKEYNPYVSHLCKTKNKRLIKVTMEENNKFVSYLTKTIEYNQKMVKESKISENHPLYMMLHKLSSNLLTHDNDVVTTLRTDQHLTQYVCDYITEMDKERMLKDCLQQIDNNLGNIQKTKEFVTIWRQVKSGSMLKEKTIFLCKNCEKNNKATPCNKCDRGYSDSSIGELETEQGRENFMLRNASRTACDSEFKQYIALFIYQYLFAYHFE